MRRFLLLALTVVFLAADIAPQEKYIAAYSAIAVKEMQRTGVPASITLAQGILESNSGRSALTVKGNNHFGIKCHNDWKGKKMYHDDDAKGECFRVYPSYEQSFKDHSDFLRYRDRYKFLFDYEVTDYVAWANGLKKAGYATDPNYARKLIKTIEDWQLYKFDKGEDREVPVVIPEAPHKIEKPRVVEVAKSKENIHFSLDRKVYETNGVPFVYAEEGESYASIAASNDLFLKEILRFNDLASEPRLAVGTVVYIQAKKNQAAKGLEKYIVGENPETLRDICQRFAVKMSAVCKLNGFTASYVPSEGDTIKLRKK